MLYTRKGDGGTTKTLHCDLPDGKAGQRLSKSSAIAEALGAVDELNSLLGFVKTQCLPDSKAGQGESLKQGLTLVLSQVQQNLFIVQAELAGAQGKTIASEKVTAMEKIIDEIEQKLPPIKTFFVSGGTPPAALFDFARTVARRAERRVVAYSERSRGAATPSQVEGSVKIGKFSLAYLNRLSSLLYALARLANHESGITEQAPTYK